jgi:hypothetical protein
MLGFGPVGLPPPAGSPLEVGTAYVLVAESGVYDITGFAAGLVFGRVLSADPGVYVIEGFGVPGRHRILPADSGEYDITGYEARLYRSSFTGDAEILYVAPEVRAMHVPAEHRSMSVTPKVTAPEIPDEQDMHAEPRLRDT